MVNTLPVPKRYKTNFPRAIIMRRVDVTDELRSRADMISLLVLLLQSEIFDTVTHMILYQKFKYMCELLEYCGKTNFHIYGTKANVCIIMVKTQLDCQHL